MSQHTRPFAARSSVRPARTLSWILAAAGAVLAAPAPAQTPPAPPARAGRAEPAAPADPIKLDEFAARGVVRLALIDLRLRAQPTREDFLLADRILSIADEITPGDPDITRQRLAVLDAADDRDTLEEMLKRVLRQDPRDTVAQLRLILLRLDRIQVVEDRIAAYERMLSKEGASLDPSVRSQLALSVAQLLRERGDTAAFAEKLKLALSLDSTNKSAALLALSFFDERVDDPVGRLELLINLLLADPADGMTHAELSRSFAAVGDYPTARRLWKTARQILDRSGYVQDLNNYRDELSMEWWIDGPAKVADDLNNALAGQRKETAVYIEAMQKSLVPMTDVRPPEDVRLDARLDRVRLLCAVAAGNAETAQNAASDIRKSYAASEEELLGLMQTENLPEAEVRPQVRALRAELISVLSLPNREPEAVAADFKALSESAETDQTTDVFLEAAAWVTLRSGDPAVAADQFRALPADRATARIGLATALAELGDKQGAIAAYRAVALEFPITVEAAWARVKLKELTGSDLPQPDLYERARPIAAMVPSWLDEVAVDPTRFMALSGDIGRLGAHNLERTSLRARLTNTTSIPLALGPDQTIDSRVLITPTAEVAVESYRASSPELLDFGRRLRLMPNESLDVVVWPDPGLTGWLMETFCLKASRVRFRLIQGFIRGAQGEILAGPMSLSASTHPVIRSPLAETHLAPVDLAARLTDAPESELPRLVTAARGLLLDEADPATDPKTGQPDPLSLAAPRLSAEERSALARAAAQRLVNASRNGKLVLIAGMPHGQQVGEMSVFDEAALRESDPLIASVALVSRARSADDPALSLAIGSPDARLASVAASLKARAQTEAPMFGRAGPGLAGIVRTIPASRKPTEGSTTPP